MKKSLIVFLTIIFCISLFVPSNVSYANSALMQADSESEHFELLPVKDDDISVASEILTFDFTKKTEILHSPICQTTAVYDMRNAKSDKTVTMGFPLVSTIDTFKSSQTEIKLDGQNIDYKPYYAFVEANEIVNLTFEEILEGLNEMDKIDTAQVGYLYKVYFSDVANTDRANIEFSMSSNSIVLHDFSGISFQENTIDFTTRKVTLETYTNYPVTYGKAYAYFYVIGDKITDMKVNALDKNSKIVDIYNSDVVEITSLNVVDYILSLKEDMTQGEIDIIASKLVEYQDSVIVAASESDLINTIYGTKCLIVLGYTVNLKGENTPNILSVSYPMDGAFSAYYEPTLYTYNYISSPAKNWASFGSFTINIYTNSDNPYVINANLDFNKVSDNGYQCIVNGVPKGNIQFSICASESPKYNKRAGSIFGATFWIKVVISTVVLLSVSGLIASAIIIIVKKVKLKKAKEEDNGKDSQDNT